MKEIAGNLLDLADAGMFDVIVHGCNCQCVMGSGIAKQIAQRYPQAAETDRATGKDVTKLGKISFVSMVRGPNLFYVVNGYTQLHYGRGLQVNYAAVRSVFKEVRDGFANKRIAYPSVGAGLGGGDWKIIRRIIDEELEGLDHTWVKFEPSSILRKELI